MRLSLSSWRSSALIRARGPPARLSTKTDRPLLPLAHRGQDRHRRCPRSLHSYLLVPGAPSSVVIGPPHRPTRPNAGLPFSDLPPFLHGRQVPGYISNYDAFAAKGVKEIFVVAVNDTFVMQAWAKKLAGQSGSPPRRPCLTLTAEHLSTAEGTKVRFIADDTGAFTTCTSCERPSLTRSS